MIRPIRRTFLNEACFIQNIYKKKKKIKDNFACKFTILIFSRKLLKLISLLIKTKAIVLFENDK